MVKGPLVIPLSTPLPSSALQLKVPEIDFYSWSNTIITISPVGSPNIKIEYDPLTPKIEAITGIP